MSTYVIGDIHGDLSRWEGIKEQIEISEKDRVVFIGDIIDRGKDGVKILQEIMGMPNAKLILGNHEWMMIKNWHADSYGEKTANIIREEWMSNGGYPTVEAMMKLSDEEQANIINYLTKSTKLKLRCKLDDGRMFYMCHGWINGDPTHDDDIHSVVWDRPERLWDPNMENGTLIIGHTPVVEFLTSHEYRDAVDNHISIFHAPHFIDIDCGCGHRGGHMRLACLRLDDMAEFYA